MVTIEVVSENPAKNIAILCGISPAPDCRLLPTAMSSTNLESILDLETTSFSVAASMTYGAVSLSPPLFALVMGVLTVAHITTSSGVLLETICLVSC